MAAMRGQTLELSTLSWHVKSCSSRSVSSKHQDHGSKKWDALAGDDMK